MITQEGVHNVLVEAMNPLQKVELSAACNNDPEKIKNVEQKMADMLNIVVDIAVNPGTIYMNSKVDVPEENSKKVKSLKQHLEEIVGSVSSSGFSIEALLSIVYSRNMSGAGPSMLTVVADYIEYLEEFLSSPSPQEEEWTGNKEDEL